MWFAVSSDPTTRNYETRLLTTPTSSARMATREASHAGSWYSSDPSRLSRELDGFLDAAGTHGSTPRALIVPHAGYSYSGAAAAWGYKNVDARAGIKRVFLLGPSHHVFLRRCALSKCATYATPLGNLAVDTGIYDELRATGHFVDMDVDVDEAEHSLELHLPYIFKCFEVEEPEHQRPTLVPIMVGSLSQKAEATYGTILAPYLDDDANLFIVSSDFCHWGERFGYRPWDEHRADVRIHQQIEEMDRAGMRIIKSKDADAFAAYLKKTGNTICGRHPIGVLLQTLRKSGGFDKTRVEFTRYEQSSAAMGWNDSSVSYASAVVFRDA